MYGGVDFSPELMIWMWRIDAWNLILRYKRGFVVNTALIRRRTTKGGIESPLSCSLTDAEKSHKKCKQEYYRLKLYAPEYRKYYLRERARHARSNGDTAKSKEILLIISQEKIRTEWRLINGAVIKI